MTTRREFIKQSSFLGMGALVMPEILKRNKFKLGLQLYTLHQQMQHDLEGTLKKIASFGYQEVETYGYNYGDNKYYWNLEPKKVKQILDDNNLKTVSGHYDLDKFMLAGKTDDDLKRYVDDCINGALILEQQYIVWPWLDPASRSIEKFKIVAEKLNRIGEQIKKAKLQLAYHNHDFEFIDHNGQIGYDVILNETDSDLVKIEMDIYWFTHSSKLSAHHYFKKYPNRFPLLHFKDMDKKDRELHTVIGDGSIDFKPYVADYQLAGVKHIFVEQGNNYVPDALNCVRQSADYMKKNFLF
jgi:sugar phosphate isomerase/epimerase